MILQFQGLYFEVFSCKKASNMFLSLSASKTSYFRVIPAWNKKPEVNFRLILALTIYIKFATVWCINGTDLATQLRFLQKRLYKQENFRNFQNFLNFFSAFDSSRQAGENCTSRIFTIFGSEKSFFKSSYSKNASISQE